MQEDTSSPLISLFLVNSVSQLHQNQQKFIMNAFDQLVFIEKHSILICKAHRYAILPKSIGTHFNSHGDEFPRARRAAMEQWAKELGDRVHNGFSSFQPITDPIPLIPQLKIVKGAVKCNLCSHIHGGATAIANMQQHLRKVHDIHASGQAAATGSRPDSSWWASHWREVTCQRFFTSANGADNAATALFEVIEPEEELRSTIPNSSSVASAIGDGTTPEPAESYASPAKITRDAEHLSHTLSTLAAQFKMAESIVKLQNESKHAVVPIPSARQTNPYLEYTKFQACIQGLPWETVRRYTAMPNAKKEPELHFLASAVKSTILVYQHTVASTARWARIRVMQEHPNDIPLKPLIHYQGFNNAHSNAVVKIFLYFYRIHTEVVPQPPLGRLTAAQKEKLEMLKQRIDQYNGQFPDMDTKHTRTKMTSVESHCHVFWVSLIMQTCIESDQALSLFNPLAFIAADPVKDQFRDAYNFATDLSAIKKIIRFAAIWRLVRKTQSFRRPTEEQCTVAHEDENVEAEDVRELMQPSTVRSRSETDEEGLEQEMAVAFQQWVEQYLTTSFPTAMAWCITTAGFISQCRYGETLDAFVRWEGSKVICRHVSTTFEAYTGMVWRVYDEACSHATNLYFVDKMGDLPKIPWDLLACNPSTSDPGYSPFSPRNGALQAKAGFLLDSMLDSIAHERNKKSTIRDLSDINPVQAYCKRVDQFLKQLLLLTHLTSGQPARGAELLSIQHENSLSDGPRNIYMHNGYVAVVPRYHKGYNRDTSVKMVFRFVPREVGSLFVYYLWHIRPFCANILSMQETGVVDTHKAQNSSSFLWPNTSGGQIDSGLVLTNLLKDASAQWMGASIGLAIFRHLIIAFDRKLHHGSRSAAVKLKALTQDEVDEVLDDIESDAREMQAGHSPKTARSVYALETERLFRSSFASPSEHLKTSTDWHNSLGFEPVPRDDTKPYVSSSHEARLLRLELCQGLDYRCILRDCIRDPHGQFQGLQKNVIHAVVGNNEPYVAYIAGTGSGKSMAYLLPAAIDSYGQTLLITPLIALRTDTIRKCKDLRLTTSRWGEPGFDETARVLLAMPEDLAKESFISMVTRRRQIFNLDRIVLDEFHYVLLPDAEYRPALQSLRDLTRFSTPMTLLSATIPISEEQHAFRELGLDGIVQTFRERTTRTNTRYEVVQLPGTQQMDTRELQQRIKRDASLHRKVLVYVHSARVANELATALNCSVYTGQMTLEEREKNQDQFVYLRSGIMIATTAFSHGVHCSDITLVCRYGEPDHLVLWAQEAGRAGRTGQPCIARIVVGTGLGSFLHKADVAVRAAVDAFIQTGKLNKKCRRITLDHYFDGNRQRMHCAAGEAQCDVCLVDGDVDYLSGHPSAAAAASDVDVRPLSDGTPPDRTPRTGGQSKTSLIPASPRNIAFGQMAASDSSHNEVLVPYTPTPGGSSSQRAAPSSTPSRWPQTPTTSGKRNADIGE
jgi:hypothetical protein